MTQKETNLRSVLFLVIGILLLLSLVICIYIVSGENDLVKTNALVVEVNKDSSGTGKTDISVTYDVDGQSYKYDYYHKGKVEEGEKVTIYYHENNPSSVQTFKTNKLIFIWPIIGLGLCILGLFELFRKNEEEEDDFETSVIGIVGNTQQLKIVTDDTPVQTYKPTPEEVVEVEVKAVKKEESVVEEYIENEFDTSDNGRTDGVSVDNTSDFVKNDEDEHNIVLPMPVMNIQNVNSSTKSTDINKTAANKMEDALVQKVQDAASNSSMNEDEIKKVIKDVLKEVIQEVKEEKADEPIVQRKVIPNNYYIFGSALVYEEVGKESQQIDLKTVNSVVRTINSEGNVVKLVVSSDRVKCILTNMKNIDLEQVASLLNNKMRTIDEDFKEVIEYKEY